MTKVVLLDRGTIGPTVEITKPGLPHHWVEYESTRREQVLERLAGVEVAITNKVPLCANTLKRLPDLKMIAVAATGYDVVDVKASARAGILVSNVRGYAMNTVPEHTFALIFALRRNLIGYRQDVLDGEWQRSGQFCFFNHEIRDLAGSRLGIIGEGVIGQSVANIGRALGMTPLFAAHKGSTGLGPLYTPFQEVIETSDVITMHAPLNSATENMISTDEFEAMTKRPLLINTSRGGLVNEAALVDAVDRGLIAGAGFDVLTSEPPKPDNPLLRILSKPNVIVTPHIAWASQEAMQTLWNQTIDHVDNFLNGYPTNVVAAA